MKCVEIIVKTHPNYGTEDYYRLRPNEYSYVRDFRSFLIKTWFHSWSRTYFNIKMAGSKIPSKVTNVLGCSYHPKSCTCDPTMINFEAEHFKLEYGTAGVTFPCYQSSLNPRHVTRSKSIRTSDMVHAILWPSIGNFSISYSRLQTFASWIVPGHLLKITKRCYTFHCWMWRFLVVSSWQFAIFIYLLISIWHSTYHTHRYNENFILI